MKTLTIWRKQEFSRQTQKKSFATTNFCYASCIRIKIFRVNKFRQRPSDLFIRSASIVAKGFHVRFPGFTLIRFQHFRIPEVWNERHFFLSIKLILVQLHAGCSFHETWSISLAWFCTLTRFCSVFTQEKFYRRRVWRLVRFLAKICQVVINHSHS